MLYQIALAQSLHQLGVLIWIGGMFFAHFALRPAAHRILEPPQRLPLLLAVFGRFFPLVWVAIVLLWGSGLWIFLVLSGSRGAVFVHAMMGMAALMTVIFVILWVWPYRHLKAAVARGDWPAAGASLARIRGLIATNLTLGLTTVVIAAAGPALLAAGFPA